MDIVIPSFRRPQQEKQTTLKTLSDLGIPVWLAIHLADAKGYAWAKTLPGVKVYTMPDEIVGIAAVRDHIVHEMHGDYRVLLLDDDLRFATRREDEPTKFRPSSSTDIRRMLSEVERMIGLYPLVGVGSREGGNRNTEQHVFNTRILRTLGYDREYLKKHDIRGAPMRVMEDFHVALQILESGKDICVCNWWVSDQLGSGKDGGCSTYRTKDVQAEAAHQLAALHPGTVRVVEKTTKGAWGGGTRTDVVISWKKARHE